MSLNSYSELLAMTEPLKLAPLRVEYDELRDEVEIEGVRYAGDVFRYMGLAPVGSHLQIIGRADGVVSIKTFGNDAYAQARFEIEHEKFRAAVEAEKARILAGQSWWQRIAKVLPFTITWKKES